jgi:alpha-L-rhamnosidase
MVDDPPSRLRTDRADRPLAIAHDSPRLAWRVPGSVERQAEFRIRLGEDPDALRDGRDAPGAGSDALWDSEVVESGDPWTVYDGPELNSRQRYYWNVRVRDADGRESPWSEPTWFETGPSPVDWTADWIAGPGGADAPAPALRTAFSLDEAPERARLYVSGLGAAELFLDGERVGDRVLDPALTDYEERVLYSAYDVTDALDAGEHALGAVLGRGRYAMTSENVWNWHEPPWHSDRAHLRLQLEVTYPDGRTEQFVSDGDWRATASPTRSDCLYAGETYDARAELGAWTEPGYDDGDWAPAERVDGPAGRPVPQAMQPMREVETLAPESISRLAEGVHVVDFGTMTAGWAELTVDGSAGTEVSVCYGEKLREDGRVDVEQEYVDAEIQTDTYVLAGGGPETWTPRFSYKGFRYVELRGYPGEPTVDDLRAKAIHTAVDDGPGGRFEASDELLERIHENTRRALLNNHHGIPTDTPVYEKNGWTGDAQLTARAALYNFDMGRFYEKWLDDFADAQRSDGEVPPIVPTSDWGYSDWGDGESGIRSPNPAWDVAYALIPWWLYRHEGDRRILERHYEGLTNLLSYFGDHAEDGVIDDGLGDWLAPGHGEIRQVPPEGPAITSTAYYYGAADVLASVADALDRPDDADRYRSLADEIYEAFDDRFFDADAGVYATGETDEYRQTSNVVPLAFGLVPDDRRDLIVANLVANVVEEHDGHLDTGIVGTRFLLPVLTETGHVDLAYEVATQTTYPSWGHWIENGATALYEMWELDSRTRDHHMFGSIDEWFYEYLVGIRPLEPGYGTVEIRPYPPSELESAAGEVDTVRGTVATNWRRDDDSFALDARIPAGAEAVVHVPTEGSDLYVDGTPAEEREDVPVDGGGAYDRAWRCRVGPGPWSFRVR